MYMLLTINDFALFNGLVFVIVRKEAILVWKCDSGCC